MTKTTKPKTTQTFKTFERCWKLMRYHISWPSSLVHIESEINRGEGDDSQWRKWQPQKAFTYRVLGFLPAYPRTAYYVPFYYLHRIFNECLVCFLLWFGKWRGWCDLNTGDAFCVRDSSALVLKACWVELFGFHCFVMTLVFR